MPVTFGFPSVTVPVLSSATICIFPGSGLYRRTASRAAVLYCGISQMPRTVLRLYPALRAAAAQLLSSMCHRRDASCMVRKRFSSIVSSSLLRSASLFFVIIHALPPFIPDTAALFFRLRQFRSFLFPFFLYNDSTSVNTRLYPNGTDEYRRE